MPKAKTRKKPKNKFKNIYFIIYYLFEAWYDTIFKYESQEEPYGIGIVSHCGQTAAVLTFVGYVLYVADKRRFAPDVKAWGSLAAVGAIALLGSAAQGAESSLGMLGMEFVCPLGIFLLSLRAAKHRTHWEKEDTILTATSLAGLALWLAFDAPQAGLAACAVLDWRAGLAIVRKVWNAPLSESAASWLVTTAACLLNTVAALGDGPVQAAYVASYTIIQIVIICALFRCLLTARRILAKSANGRSQLPKARRLGLNFLPPVEMDFLPRWVWS